MADTNQCEGRSPCSQRCAEARKGPQESAIRRQEHRAGNAVLGSPPQASVPELPRAEGPHRGGGAGLGRLDALLPEHLGPVPRPALRGRGWLVSAEEARGEEGGLEGRAPWGLLWSTERWAPDRLGLSEEERGRLNKVQEFPGAREAG